MSTDTRTAAPCPLALPLCQVFLLLIMFVSVPWMLLPKPLILKKRAEARATHSARVGGWAVGVCVVGGEVSPGGCV